MGLTGSLHCAGMCGPIVWVLPFMNGPKKWLGIALYHLARISVYASMAFVLYNFKGLFHPQWQQYISIALGIALLIAGILSFIPGRYTGISLPWAGWVKNKLGSFIGKPALGSLFVAGLLNGLLPCGLEYMALSAAVAAPSAMAAGISMYAFGIGTVPVLLLISIFKQKGSFLQIHKLKKLAPVVVFFFSALFIVRGLNLGVPYLSPKIEIENNHIKASCCHK